MATVTILNTTSNISGDTIVTAENNTTVTGLVTFSRSPSAPFAVQAGSAVVSNLDADKVDGKHSTDFLLLDGTQTLTAGIPFPATQVPSSGVNVLDDYEEGNWTPTLVGTTGAGTGSTYTVQVGRYIKVGKKVTCWGRITITNLGTLPTQAAIGGLPFAAENVTNLNPAVTVPYFANLTTAVHFIAGFVLPNSTTAALFHNAAGGAGTSCIGTVAGDLSNTLDIVFQIIYQANA